MIVKPWTASDKELLIKMWQNGASAHVIAARLGNGRTRNAVLGYLFRLRRSQPELGLRLEVMKPRERVCLSPKPKIPVPPKPKAKPQPIQLNLFTPIEEVPPPEGGVPYFEVRRLQCKYILNTSKDPHNVKCCGGSIFRGSSWCRTHYHEVFTTRTAPEKQVAHLSSGKTQVASKFQFRRM
jgi:GcrA cell cycle regulator